MVEAVHSDRGRKIVMMMVVTKGCDDHHGCDDEGGGDGDSGQRPINDDQPRVLISTNLRGLAVFTFRKTGNAWQNSDVGVGLFRHPCPPRHYFVTGSQSSQK